MDTKEWAELKEALLKEQLRVIRRFLKNGSGVKKSQPLQSKGKSNVDIVKNILEASPTPLHVTEIIKKAKSDYQTIIDRESIVSALSKKVNKGDTFVRAAPNTFALKNKEIKTKD